MNPLEEEASLEEEEGREAGPLGARVRVKAETKDRQGRGPKEEMGGGGKDWKHGEKRVEWPCLPPHILLKGSCRIRIRRPLRKRGVSKRQS